MFRLADGEFVRFIFHVGLYALALAFLVFGVRLGVQFRSAVVHTRTEQFIARWRGILEAHDAELPEQLPLIPRMQLRFFVLLWLGVYNATVTPGRLASDQTVHARERLREIVRRTGVDRYAAQLVESRHLVDQIAAAQLLGYVGGPTAWTALEDLTSSASPFCAMLGLQGLLRADAQRAAPLAVDRLRAEESWPEDAVRGLLLSLEPAATDALVAEAHLRIEQAPHVARLLEHARAPNDVVPALSDHPVT